MKQAFTEEHLDILSSLATLVACQICRVKGGNNLEVNGSCRHRQNISPMEVCDRLSYCVTQADNARDLAKAIRGSTAILGMSQVKDDWATKLTDALNAYDETERSAGLV